MASFNQRLHKCKVDLYMRGGHMQPISRFSPKIHVFSSLGECLLAFEAAPDGMYICYIRSNDSADGYFGFYIKSNGNLLSVHERIDESYPGEHSHHRNHRWVEGKEFALFPYSEVISHSTTDKDGKENVKRDYKGYATQYFISEEDIDGRIVIYFKNYAQEQYVGGITYSGTIQSGLKAGEIKQIMSSHFSASDTKVVFITIG